MQTGNQLQVDTRLNAFLNRFCNGDFNEVLIGNSQKWAAGTRDGRAHPTAPAPVASVLSRQSHVGPAAVPANVLPSQGVASVPSPAQAAVARTAVPVQIHGKPAPVALPDLHATWQRLQDAVDHDSPLQTEPPAAAQEVKQRKPMPLSATERAVRSSLPTGGSSVVQSVLYGEDPPLSNTGAVGVTRRLSSHKSAEPAIMPPALSFSPAVPASASHGAPEATRLPVKRSSGVGPKFLPSPGKDSLSPPKHPRKATRKFLNA